MNPQKLLLVDDEEGFSETLKPYLELKGFLVFSAISGQEAMEILKKENPEIMLLDLLLKGKMDGMEVLRETRKLSPQTKIIITTGLDGGPKHEALKEGASLYLNKPLTLSMLSEAIEKVVRQDSP